MTPQCPKCGSHQEHIYTIEGRKRYAIERCPRCEFAGWPDNPIPYDEYLRKRRQTFTPDGRNWPHA